jgi:hypothetical protein
MRAGLRLGMAIAAAGLALGGAPVLAQEAPPEATTNTPATESIGPRELQGFSLSGKVTQPAEQPQAPAIATQPPSRPTNAATAPASTEPRSASSAPAPQPQASVEPTRGAPGIASTDSAQPAPTRPQPVPSSSVTMAPPPADGSSIASSPNTPSAQTGFPPEPETPGSGAPQHGFPLLLWLLAAVALGAGGAFLFWRSRSREALADGPQFDMFAAPEPAPHPVPAPAPAPAPRAAPANPAGIVSTRLRPWLELSFEPIRCVVDEEKVTFEFELALFNSGNAPAREVLIEATLFNAGPEQEREIAAFFEAPVGQGQRIAAIPPLQRMNLRTEVSAPKAGLQLYEIAGRHVIVPLIGFNALYKWGLSGGQTSQSFLLGRDTKSEKLAPFRMDLGPRIFRGLGARPLPQSVRN